jgi:hypothetical protein
VPCWRDEWDIKKTQYMFMKDREGINSHNWKSRINLIGVQVNVRPRQAGDKVETETAWRREVTGCNQEWIVAILLGIIVKTNKKLDENLKLQHGMNGFNSIASHFHRKSMNVLQEKSPLTHQKESVHKDINSKRWEKCARIAILP